MRLIDAVVVEERLWDARRAYQLMDNSQDADKIMHGIYNAEQIIREASTVDAVPVCRCKDCRYSREPNRHDRGENSACEGVLICCVGFDHVYPSSDNGLIFVDKNGYCSYGERKGGADDAADN